MRRIGFLPDVTLFKPHGVPMSDPEVVVITHEELEAIRLVDFLDLDQEEAASRMEVSRRSMAADLRRARWKIADALLHGKALSIEGGDFLFQRGNNGMHQQQGVNEDAIWR